MPRLTKAQQKAVLRVYNRGPIHMLMGKLTIEHFDKPVSFLAFRRTVQHGSDCVMVYWARMWLGIEPDGYIHS